MKVAQYTETLESGMQKNAESCENSKKCFTEHSDLMNTLTSVAPVPYLSNANNSTDLPSRYHEDKFTGFQICVYPSIEMHK